MCWQATGYRRTKNPRIWSVHDLERIARGRYAQAQEASAPTEQAPAQVEAPEPGLAELRAPMEGSFWSRPAPTEPAFIQVGDTVKADARVALVEVMKTFTPIRATAAGTFVQWAVGDGDPVQPGQVIGWVRPE